MAETADTTDANPRRAGMPRCPSNEETVHLLRVPANARHLLESLRQARAGQRRPHDLA